MTERERFERIQRRYPHPHHNLFTRPHYSRRHLFRLAGTGLAGSFLGRMAPTEARAQSAATWGTAKQCILLFLRGAPSHVDLFDFKYVNGVTPDDFAPETINGVTMPMGLLGNTAQHLDKIAIIRSGLSWALAHPLAQTWFQIGRNPTSALGRVAPHIGSVVSIEMDSRRKETDVLPSFISLNANNTPGSGFLPSSHGPFKTAASTDGLANTTHPNGQPRFQSRMDLLGALDSPLRGPDSPLGDKAAGMGSFYESAQGLMYNPVVEDAFSVSEADASRYGDSGIGNACLLASQIVKADIGAKFIQCTQGSWDHHQDIYLPNAPRSIYTQGRQFDAAFASLLADLDAAGKLDETLVVAAGEFGRTVGPLTNTRNGRDHFLQMFYVLAGGGVQGGRVIGATNDVGAFTTEPGWSRDRPIRSEDIEATIYSALGIDWTTVRYDDPLGRGFEYVPMSGDDVYGPVDELRG